MAWSQHGYKLLERYGYDAAAVHERAEFLAMLYGNTHHAYRIDLKDGKCAWLTRPKVHGGAVWHCAAIAPMHSVVFKDYATRAELFDGEPWPHTWITAFRVGLRGDGKDEYEKKRRLELQGPQAGGWAWARQPDGCYALAPVTADEEGTLYVQESLEFDPIPIDDTGLAWKVFAKDDYGCRRFWERGEKVKNYRIMCIRVGSFAWMKERADQKAALRGRKAEDDGAAADAPKPQKSGPGGAVAPLDPDSIEGRLAALEAAVPYRDIPNARLTDAQRTERLNAYRAVNRFKLEVGIVKKVVPPTDD